MCRLKTVMFVFGRVAGGASCAAVTFTLLPAGDSPTRQRASLLAGAGAATAGEEGIKDRPGGGSMPEAAVMKPGDAPASASASASAAAEWSLERAELRPGGATALLSPVTRMKSRESRAARAPLACKHKHPQWPQCQLISQGCPTEVHQPLHSDPRQHSK